MFFIVTSYLTSVRKVTQVLKFSIILTITREAIVVLNICYTFHIGGVDVQTVFLWIFTSRYHTTITTTVITQMTNNRNN